MTVVDHLVRAEIRENLIVLCRDHPGCISSAELWDQVQLPLLFLATGSELPLYPIVRCGRPVAVLKSALTAEEEIEMAGYLMDAARKISAAVNAELESLPR